MTANKTDSRTTRSALRRRHGKIRNFLRSKSNRSGFRLAQNLKSPHTRYAKPQDLDVRGLGSKLCEVLGVRSGDTVEFHLLADGSIRVVNYGK